jgi:sugar/nucleoside kinase (ribokinase family)
MTNRTGTSAVRTTWDAVVAGHLCLDIIPDLSRLALSPQVMAAGMDWTSLLRPGSLVEIGDAMLSTGGAVSNTGLALHRLGIRAHLMGKVGADDFGQVVQGIVARRLTAFSDASELEAAQGMTTDRERGTSYTLIISPPGIDRAFLYAPGTNATFGIADIDYESVARSRLFHFGYPPLMRRTYLDGGRELTEMFRRAHELGVTTSLDMALPDPNAEAGRVDWAAILERTLPYVGVFLPSIEEILYMLRPTTYQTLRQSSGGDLIDNVTPALLSDLAAQLLAMGPGIVGLKLGERGFYLRTAHTKALASLGRAAPADLSDWADRELWMPCFKADLVGTTGAGDAAIAGFLAALLRGLPVVEAVTMAVAVGACNVEAADALSGLRSWEETRARVARGWEHYPLALSDPEWTAVSDDGLWCHEVV